jgi:hypothetical protein
MARTAKTSHVYLRKPRKPQLAYLRTKISNWNIGYTKYERNSTDRDVQPTSTTATADTKTPLHKDNLHIFLHVYLNKYIFNQQDEASIKHST